LGQLLAESLSEQFLLLGLFLVFDARQLQFSLRLLCFIDENELFEATIVVFAVVVLAVTRRLICDSVSGRHQVTGKHIVAVCLAGLI